MKRSPRMTQADLDAIYRKMAPKAGSVVARPAAPKVEAKSKIEETFALHCKASALVVEREYVFHPKRNWRFDFAIPARKIAIEVEGGIWTQGRHNRGAGMIEDMRKYNEAARLGWAVYRFDGGAVERGEAVQYIQKIVQET